jgi:aspartyl-tRNA(Asn)/glutamyl-tRNA(Gln) amidotransferase subunit B
LQRTKEAEQDYRYFPEPDIPFLAPRRELVEEVRATLPEMPDARRARFVREYALTAKDAATLTESPALADYFEQSARASKGDGKVAANYVLRDVLRLVKEGVIDPARLRAPEWSLAPVLEAISSGAISSSQASMAIQTAFRENVALGEVVARPEFRQLSDARAIGAAVDGAIAQNPQIVAAYRAGKRQALEALVGAVMKETRGKANHAMVRQMLQERLG